MKVVTTVMSVAVLLMVGGAIYETADSIKTRSIDNNKKSLNQLISQTGTQTVDLGAPGPETSSASEEDPAKQLRALAVFNMLAASDCRILKNVHQMTVAEQKTPQAAEYKKTTLSEVSSTTPSYIEWFEGFDPLTVNTEFRAACVSGSSVPYEVKENIPVLPEIKNPFETADKGAENPSVDMEGRFGKTKFTVQRTFLLPEAGSTEHTGLIAINSLDSGTSLPDFWVGSRASAFVPDGLKATYDGKADTVDRGWLGIGDTNVEREKLANIVTADERNKADFWTGLLTDAYEEPGNEFPEAYYAFRVRMKDVPILVQDPRKFSVDHPMGTKNNYRQNLAFLRQARFVFCEGARGYIQSNAGSPDNEGESTGNKPKKEDVVYPQIKMTRQGKDGKTCLETDEDEARGDLGPAFKRLEPRMENAREKNCYGRASIGSSDSVEGKVRMGYYENSKGEKVMEELDYYCGLKDDTLDYGDSTEEGNPQFAGEFDYFYPYVQPECRGRSYDITKFYYSAEHRSGQAEAWITSNGEKYRMYASGTEPEAGIKKSMQEVSRSNEDLPSRSGGGSARLSWDLSRYSAGSTFSVDLEIEKTDAPPRLIFSTDRESRSSVEESLSIVTGEDSQSASRASEGRYTMTMNVPNEDGRVRVEVSSDDTGYSRTKSWDVSNWQGRISIELQAPEVSDSGSSKAGDGPEEIKMRIDSAKVLNAMTKGCDPVGGP